METWALILLLVGTREIAVSTINVEFASQKDCTIIGDAYKEEMKKISDKALPRYLCIKVK